MQLRFYISLVFAMFLLSCNDDSTLETEISKINVDLAVDRFDRAFAQAEPTDLKQLKDTYPFLFSKHIADSIWILRIKDSLRNRLLMEVDTTFKDMNTTRGELIQLFQHLKYYDTTFRIPRVITLTNDVGYRDRTMLNDSLVLIALDNYLGSEHEFYQNISKFITANMKPEQIVVDIAEGYAKNYTYQPQRNTFLEEMIYFGKLLYFKDVMIPFKSDAQKMSYTEEQLQWAQANESEIWSYFIERELLYSTDRKLLNRFITDAPFSKFYLEIDNESPGRLGQYIGWQIVKAYAETTGAKIFDVLNAEPELLFRKSKFKPKK